MNSKDIIRKAAAFLLIGRNMPATEHNMTGACAEVTAYLEVQDAIKMAELAGSVTMTPISAAPATAPGDDPMRCTTCTWAGLDSERPVDERGIPRCPQCNGVLFQRGAA